jgi:type II secretory pathway pseudopilin PulG
MKNKQRQLKRAFTITELLVAIGLLAALLAGSSIVFQKAIQSERIARATAEITRKLQVITDQIDNDFLELCKDGEIMLLWVANPVDDDGDGTIDRYERLDRVMFYTTADCTTYHEQPTISGTPPGKYITGNSTRVCYIFAKNPANEGPKLQSPSDRILLRTQHIYISDGDLAGWPALPAVSTLTQEQDFRNAYFALEYDKRTMSEWMVIPYDDGSASPPPGGKATMFSIITGTTIGPANMPISERGPIVDIDDPSTIHMLFSEGVGQFSIQGWYYDDAVNNTYGKFDPPIYRWFPMLDLDPSDTDLLTNSDFILAGAGSLHATNIPGLFYHSTYGGHVMGPYPPLAGTTPQYPPSLLNEANFNNIPGLGRALKFTFTLYDSRGIFENGKTFTHIVYLDW